MATGNDEAFINKQKESVDVLRKSGIGEYELFLKKSDIIDFLNDEEKQYIINLGLDKIIYADEDDEGFQGVCFDTDVCTSLETDAPQPKLIANPVTELVFSPGICRKIIEIIRESTRSIKIAMFMFTDPTILQEICEKITSADNPHISVEILVDETQFMEFMKMAKKLIKDKFSNKEIELKLKKITRKGNASQKMRSGKAHEKFIICDESVAVTGSYNFTWASEHINYENVIISRDKEAIVTPLLNHFKRISAKGKSQTL